MNRCRLFLKVFSIAELAAADGQTVRLEGLEGQQAPDFRPRSVGWPEQGNPSKAEWLIWRKCLEDTVCSKQGKLFQSIGPWKEDVYDSWHITESGHIFIALANSIYTAEPRNFRSTRTTQARFSSKLMEVHDTPFACATFPISVAKTNAEITVISKGTFVSLVQLKMPQESNCGSTVHQQSPTC